MRRYNSSMEREPNVHDSLARRFEEQKKALIEEVEQLRAELDEMVDGPERHRENSDESPPDAH